MLCILIFTSAFHFLPRVDPSSCVHKQLCAQAHLGCTHEAGTSYSFLKLYFVKRGPSTYLFALNQSIYLTRHQYFFQAY